MASTDRHSRFLEQTQAFWRDRTERSITAEEARRMAGHATGFFRLLHEWAEAEAHDATSRTEASREP